MRLRPLTEDECYARCYGGRGHEWTSLVRVMPGPKPRPRVTGERLRELFEERLEARAPEAEVAA